MSIKKTLKDTIQWNEHTDDVAMIASHNCSDMLINIGKRQQNESYYEGPTAKSDQPVSSICWFKNNKFF